MRLSKDEREAIRRQFDGRCAYCGCMLQDRWHVDHVEPVVREIKRVEKGGQYRRSSGKPLRPEHDRQDNLMPACPACNLHKRSMSLESWRKVLARTVGTLQAVSAYRFASRFGLVQETGKPVVFWFERVGK